MIIILFLIGVAIISSIGWIFCNAKMEWDLADICGATFAFAGIILLIIVMIVIPSKISVNKDILEARINYDSLIARKELLESEDADSSALARSQLIVDIAEWNTMVARAKYNITNPWINWFCSKKFAESLKFIDTDYLEEE